MKRFLAGMVIGWFLFQIQALCDDFQRRKDIYHDQPWMCPSFPVHCWQEVSNPVRGPLRWIWNAIRNNRCAKCHRILTTTGINIYIMRDRCDRCYFGDLLRGAREQTKLESWH